MRDSSKRPASDWRLGMNTAQRSTAELPEAMHAWRVVQPAVFCSPKLDAPAAYYRFPIDPVLSARFCVTMTRDYCIRFHFAE